MLQKDIANILAKRIDCKKEIWKDLKDKIFLPPPTPKTTIPLGIRSKENNVLKDKEIKLTKSNNKIENIKDILVAPGHGMNGCSTEYTIDTTDFVNGGRLVIDIMLDDNGESDASFAINSLYGEQLDHNYNVAKGSSLRLKNNFSKGQVFTFTLSTYFKAVKLYIKIFMKGEFQTKW